MGGRLFAIRFPVANGVAVAGHALGLALAFLAARRPPEAPPPPAPSDVVPILVELDTPTAAPPPPDPTAPPAPVAEARIPASPTAPRRAPALAAIVAGGAPDDSAAPGGSADGPVSAAPASPAPAGSSQASASRPPDKLPPPLLPLALHAPPGVLGGPSVAAQGQAGLTAGAQVMASAQKAAETSGPSQGHGTIRITVEGDGAVSSVVATGVGWEAATQAIRNALAGRRLRVPKGSKGVVISLSVDAKVTYVPRVISGEDKARPMEWGSPAGGDSTLGDDHAGFFPGAPRMAVIDPFSLLPMKRRTVKVDLVSEQPR